MFAPYCPDTLPLGLAVTALYAGGWIWRQSASSLVSWSEITIAMLTAASGAGAVWYVSSLARQSAMRQRLVDQVRGAQADRAAAEREQGRRSVRIYPDLAAWSGLPPRERLGWRGPSQRGHIDAKRSCHRLWISRTSNTRAPACR